MATGTAVKNNNECASCQMLKQKENEHGKRIKSNVSIAGRQLLWQG